MIKKIFLNIIFLSISFTATVSFYIDMSDSEFPNSNYDSVMINGSWCSSGSGWDGWCLTLSDDNNDNIYEGNVDLNDGDYEYVIVVSGPADNGSGWGQIINAPSLSSCDFNSSDSYYNYGFTIQNNDIEQRYCAGVCDAVCDENSSVISWGSEIVIVPYRSPADGKMHRYFVDFIIETRNKNKIQSCRI